MANPRVFFDITVDGNSLGRIVMEVSVRKRKRAYAYVTAETGAVICLRDK